MKEKSIKKRVTEISTVYFDYMALSFPVMSLSDEFYFFPRAEKGVLYLNRLDSLDADKIKDDICYIKSLKRSLLRLDGKKVELETRIDIRLLSQSMNTFLREFDDVSIWRVDPNLYIKIILLGLDQLSKRFSLMGTDVDGFLAARISQIPRLLKEAGNNLREVPRVYSEVAIEALDCSISYLTSAGKSPRNRALSRAISSLNDFRKFLIRKSCSTQFIEGRGPLKKILKDSFSCRMSPEEIFEIGSESYRSTLRKLKRVSGTINAGKTWKGILASYSVRPKGRKGLIGLYSCEIKNLLEFFENKKIIGISQGQRIVVNHTPYFMRPIRASASYSSPVTNDRKEPAYFYITPHNDLHNEYKFVTAHETYPGHHLLDTIRRQNINPVRRQIESPLFYEGWASYAESLIDQFGYIKDKRQKLLCLRRQAWRAVRAMLDVGIRINRLNISSAGKLLEELGYSRRISEGMLRHYVLSPGYQLCYTIGKFEIERLRKSFSSKLGLRKFHDLLLEGGQIPFDLAEERLRSKT